LFPRKPTIETAATAPINYMGFGEKIMGIDS
jgi:hypothetical protein